MNENKQRYITQIQQGIEQQQWAETLQLLSEWQREAKADADVYYWFGKFYQAQADNHQAYAFYQQAVALSPNAAFRFALLHCEELLTDSTASQLALLKKYDQFLLDFPDNALAYHNRSDLLKKLGFYQLALQDCEKCLSLLPDYPLAHCNKSFILNALGDYLQGFAEYEWRWQTGLSTFQRPHWQLQLWQGEPIGDAKLLIYAEQGLGDNLQFVRYAILAKQQGFNVVVVNHKPLEKLLAFNLARFGVATAFNGEKIADLVYYVPMMSLPYHFKTRLETIPYPQGYLEAEADYFAKFSKKMTACKAKIGLVWSGSAKHARNHFRSLSLPMLTSLFSLDAEFHCLQKELSQADLAYASKLDNLFIWANEINDFSDTAGLVAQMDLVISVDTSVAHLSAAMGKKTWIMLTYHPDFRWLLERTDSPWYPDVTLFRQDFNQQWTSVVADLQQQLANFLQQNF